MTEYLVWSALGLLAFLVFPLFSIDINQPRPIVVSKHTPQGIGQARPENHQSYQFLEASFHPTVSSPRQPDAVRKVYPTVLSQQGNREHVYDGSSIQYMTTV